MNWVRLKLMKFNVTPEEYAKILKTDKYHERFISKLNELGFSKQKPDNKQDKDNTNPNP